MYVEVPWGTGTTGVEVDSAKVAGVLDANVERKEPPGLPLRAALTERGTGFDRFLAEAPSPLLVVVNDATRPTPSADVLAALRPGLEEWLAAPARDLAFVIATGTHRAVLPKEIEAIFGVEFAGAHAGRIFCHDSRDQEKLVRIGRTVRDTEILVNRLLVEARSLCLINSVEPHYFAGYTGGRKSIIPGLAGYDTVLANHSLSMEPGSETLVLTGNPVHEDLEEAMALAIAGKRVFSVQLVLGKDHRTVYAAAGELEDTFQRAVKTAEKQFVLDIDRRCEIVVAVAPHPMDCNLYQTNKAIQSGALAVKDGGVVIVVSECPFGLGENQVLFDALAAAGSPVEVLKRAAGEEYRLGVQQAVRVASLLARAEVYAVTSLRDEDVRAMFMTPFSDLREAVAAAFANQGEEAQILFLKEASITVPRVRRTTSRDS